MFAPHASQNISVSFAAKRGATFRAVHPKPPLMNIATKPKLSQRNATAFGTKRLRRKISQRFTTHVQDVDAAEEPATGEIERGEIRVTNLQLDSLLL